MKYRIGTKYSFSVAPLIGLLSLSLIACTNTKHENLVDPHSTQTFETTDIAMHPHAKQPDGFPNTNIIARPSTKQIEPVERDQLIHELSAKRNRDMTPQTDSVTNAERLRFFARQKENQTLQIIQSSQ